MKSGFVRKGAVSSADVGTRPGLHGQTLISTGWADWDRILRGGLPLGTLTLLVEDCHSQQHLNFIRYFLAEAVLTKQPAAWFSSSAPEGGVAAFLPAVVSEESSSSAASTSKGTGATNAGVGGGPEEGDGELRIAWQYRKYIQSAQRQRDQEQAEQDAAARQAKQRSSGAAGTSDSSSSGGGSTGAGRSAAQKAVESGVARQWCHTYDLSRSMAPELIQQHGLVCQACSGTGGITSAVQQAQQFISRHVSTSPAAPATSPTAPPIPSKPPGASPAGRVVVQSLLSPAWSHTDSSQEPNVSQQQGQTSSGGWEEGGGDDAVWREAARALYVLRHAVQDARCAVLVTLQADLLTPSQLLRLQHMCHVVLTLDSLSDSSDVYKLMPDPTSAAALLSIQRLPGLGMLAPRIPDPQLYVVRHKRRKLAITPVEVDPDAEVRQQEATAAAAAELASMGLKQPNGATTRSAPRATGRAQPAQGLEF